MAVRNDGGAPGFRSRRRKRRIAAAVIAATGLIAVVSALTRPLRNRLRIVTDVFSVGAVRAANGLVAAAGIGLLLLARAILRGQRRAWWLALGTLGFVLMGHLLKGVDFEEALGAAAAIVYLGVNGDAFRARSHLRAGRHALATLSLGVVGVFSGAFVALEAASSRHGHQRLGVGRGVRDALRSLGAQAPADISARLDGFVRTAVVATGAAVALVALWVSLRPVIVGVVGERQRADDEKRARSVLSVYGGGTLDYFALRDDKTYFFRGRSMISYAVYGSVCVVSPDPIGPLDERRDTWAAFRGFADDEGWIVAVLAAGQEWLDLYNSFGMLTMYVGDEAIVDVASFRLDGGDRKSLRQAVNRVARNGYRVEFYDPACVESAMREKLDGLMAKSRRGGVERGFSMTLGRIFDARDQGLLLAVCIGPDGSPCAFCQYVPSPRAGGWSLDLMRRDTGEHPNGLLDFVIVETIRHLIEGQQQSLGLNFAAMRAILASETGTGWWPRLQRRLLIHLSRDMQISSLWHFNAKYGPRWVPRYVAVDGRENMGTVAIALARAESLWEVPVVGRWFRSTREKS